MNKAEVLNSNIKLILKRRKISRLTLAEKFSMPLSTFNHNLKSPRGFPVETAFLIADELGFSIEELSREDFPERYEEMLRTETAKGYYPELTQKEITLLNLYRKLSAAGQELLPKVVALVLESYTPDDKDADLLGAMTQIAQSPEGE